MAHTFAYLGLLVLFAVGSNAWLFSSRPTSASATHGVNEQCMQHGRDGSCEFYECFEERLPCGRDWYIRRIGNYYCDKMQRLRSTFSPAGQTFLDDTTRCLTMGLLHHYQADMVDCHNLKHDAIANISRCYIDHAFCSIFNENAQQFFDLFEPSDLVSRGASSIWVEMLQLAGECGTEAVASLTSMASQSVSGVAQSVWQSLSDAFSDN